MIASRAVKEGELPMRIFVVVVAVCGALGCAKPADRPEEAPESTFRLRAGAWEKCVITHLVDYDPDFHVWCRAPKTPAIERWLRHTDALSEALAESRGHLYGCVEGPCNSYTAGLAPAIFSLQVLGCSSKALLYRVEFARCGTVDRPGWSSTAPATVRYWSSPDGRGR